MIIIVEDFKMKIEKEKRENVTRFKDVKIGQCFKHSYGSFYIRMGKMGSSTNNCVNLSCGSQGLCLADEKVKVFENATVVLGD